jgi:hypothetical protein
MVWQRGTYIEQYTHFLPTRKRGVINMSKLNEMREKFPQTEFWNDSCSCKELAYAIENGGTGATTSPVIVGNVLKKELPDWEDTIKQVIADNPTWTEDDVAWDIIGKLGTKASKLLLPMFEESHGQKGRISFRPMQSITAIKTSWSNRPASSLHWFPTARSRLLPAKPASRLSKS